jgi:hypothetical protein
MMSHRGRGVMTVAASGGSGAAGEHQAGGRQRSGAERDCRSPLQSSYACVSCCFAHRLVPINLSVDFHAESAGRRVAR